MENKITEEQLKNIQDQQTELNSILHELGLLESQKHALLHKIADVNEDVEALKKELEKQYGAVNINVEDGTYTKIENEEEEVAVSHV
tara:strand:+ start:124 stop:384 length:261 start_codon:yes stop_codon:yes gene_type:complete